MELPTMTRLRFDAEFARLRSRFSARSIEAIERSLATDDLAGVVDSVRCCSSGIRQRRDC